ncbi:Fusaric acid resistance protein-like-domain-containing protein [Choanephora cucurbitarum]|nr:Fusaric acid resistance protein-like-domain-containing protein [Choanephora cucurbitarum]
MSNSSSDTRTPSGLSLLFNSDLRPPNAYTTTTQPSNHTPVSSYSSTSPDNSIDEWPLFFSTTENLSRTVSSSSYFDNQSTYEVILDDGTRQRRTVSLSTVQPDLHFYQSDMHSHARSTETSPFIENRRLLEDDDKSVMHDTPNSITSFFSLTVQQKMILKCSLAYSIGSLFTFAPYLNSLCGPHVASHLAATVTVFFNPAKTVGGMIEAAGLAWIYTLAALALSLGSMCTTDFFLERQMPWIAYAISLGFWLTGSIFTISYIKVKHNKPSVLAASGLACIILIIVIVRQGSGNEAEFNLDIIIETFVIVAIGSLISFAVCVLVWPMTASKKLKTNIDTSLSSIRILLKLLTKTFLLDDDLPEFTANATLENAFKAHRTSFTTLRPVLKEAQLEFYNLEMMRHGQGYARIVESLERLAQHMNGLKSSCGLQMEFMQTPKPTHYGTMQTSSLDKQLNIKAGPQRKRMEFELKREKQGPVFGQGKEDEAFVQFIHSVRSPMKSLAYTCKQTILHLQAYFMQQATESRSSFYLLRQNLTSAIDLFEVSQNQALLRFYKKRFSRQVDINRLHTLFMTQKDVPMDDIYLVYFFAFCLLELAKELLILLECVQYIFEDMQEWNQNRSLSQWIYSLFSKNQDTYPFNRRKTTKDTPFIPNNRNTLDTLHTPVPKTRIRRVLVRLWDFLSQFGTYRVKYAVKSTVTAVLISVLAFIPATRPYFTSFKMEWTLITAMAVMSPTVGATNMGAALRVLATIVGCLSATIIYTLFKEYTVILWLVTWIVSVFSFWMILNHKHGRFGFFGLLAYNLIVLYKYNHRMDDAIRVVELSWTRCVAVSLGVLIGLIVTTYVWPYEARTQVRKELSDFLLRLSWLYQQLVSIYSEDDSHETYTASPNTLSLLVEPNQLRGQGLQMRELSLQIELFELQSLLAHAANEPRLKGPFPVKAYRDMMTCCQNILDKFLTIRVVILKDVWAVYVRRSLMAPAAKEFMEMSGHVLLYFYLLASALQLKTPLPPYLPPAEKARQQLMQRLQNMPPLIDDTNVLTLPDEKRDECYMIYYAYVILMESIIRELDMLGTQMKELFGALVPDEQWARCFGQSPV